MRPEALLLISSHCPHCQTVLNTAADLVKRGALGQLTVVNLEQRPEVATQHGVRSVPWLRIGEFEFTGLHAASELEVWAHKADTVAGWADYFHMLLKEGRAAQVVEIIHAEPSRLSALLPIVANPEASLNVRLGAGMIFETFAGTAAMATLTHSLGKLTRHDDARVRADACHYLSFTDSVDARPYLEAALNDPDAEVREIAADGLDSLGKVPTAD